MNQPILKYLQQVRELEGIRYTQDRLTAHLAACAASLGKEAKIDIPKAVVTTKNEDKGMRTGLIVGIVVAGIVASIVLDSLKIFERGFFDTIWILIKLVFLLIIIGVVSMVVGSCIGKRIDKKKAKAIDLENTIDALALISEDKNRVQKELEIREKIMGQLRQIKQQRDKVMQTLSQLYDLNVVHPKYRSLVPITTFCEYLETGRCTQLEGHEGAYNIYEQEVRLDRIATKLDVIIQKLDSIRDSQYDLYQIISQTNTTISKVLAENRKMLDSLNVIQENTELVAYNTHANKVMVSAIGDMMVMQELLNNR